MTTKLSLLRILISVFSFMLLNGTFMSQELLYSFYGVKDSSDGWYFGRSVSSTGDVNGDGYDDIIIGCKVYNNGAGRVYVYFGSADLDSTADLILESGEEGEAFGEDVNIAGDLNGDGYDDVIVGAPEANNESGYIYVFYGGSVMNAEADLIIKGKYEINWLGVNISGAGDVNGDGYDDMIAYDLGRTFIYFGGENMDAEEDVVMTEMTTMESVTSAGDLNGDGYGDVAIGCPSYNIGNGVVYIYYGGADMDPYYDLALSDNIDQDYFGRVAGGGDVNGDGYSDIIVSTNKYNSYSGRAYLYYGGADMDSIPDVTFESEEIGSYFGHAAFCACDINNDNYDDIIIGAHKCDSSTGRVYVYYGGSGTSTDSLADITIDGENKSDLFGLAISSGDPNNDGYDEIVIGAYRYSDSTHKGKVYIYSSESPTAITSGESDLNAGFELSQNYPNPFNPTTIIEYQVPESGNVSIKVYDLLGQEVTTLVSGSKAAGSYSIEFDASKLASGIYIYRMQAGDYISVKKLVLLK